jgi:membrane fusion protein (multidrug efflux system)
MKPAYLLEKKIRFLFILLLSIVLISCGEDQNKNQAKPVDVSVVEVIKKDTPIYKEFVGQMYGLKDIPIRARVQGFLEGIFFDEGRPVKKGQLLYTIDPQPFMADVAAKESMLAEAQILLVNAENELARYKPLAASKAVSQSDLDAAQATRDAAEQSVNAAKANLELSQINLSYTKIKAPIHGMIGKTEAREGEFVGKDPNPVILNTVSRIDTVRVQFFLTESEYLVLSKAWLVSRKNDTEGPDGDDDRYINEEVYNLELILSDGSTYNHKGQVDFINRNIDPSTGSMLVQAHFPNPDKLLRPGLYSKVKAEMRLVKGALLIPSRCVTELQGQYSVMLLSDSSTITRKDIKVGGQFGDLVMVSEGLSETDQVVIDGIQKVSTGTSVNPTLVEFESETNPE